MNIKKERATFDIWWNRNRALLKAGDAHLAALAAWFGAQGTSIFTEAATGSTERQKQEGNQQSNDTQ